MLVWGDNTIGSCYLRRRDILYPTKLPQEDAILKSMKVLAGGENHCCILDSDHAVTIFDHKDPTNDIATSTKMATLTKFKIIDIFSGGSHMFAVAKDGRAYGWGENKYGQLGWKDDSEAYVSVPASVPLPPRKQAVQISCGVSHTLVLCNDGSVYAMGDNTYGQLGIGIDEPASKPTEVLSIAGLPVTQVEACGWHSFCVTVSGRVFCWGRNDFGQLGLGDQKNRNVPCPLNMQESIAIKFVAGGDYHSAILTHDGQLFTFGSSGKGQLGNGNISRNVVNPEHVSELMGSVVTQVACGKTHTMAYVPDSSNIFVWGDGGNGQLGQNRKLKCLAVPSIVEGSWRSSNSPCEIKQIYACGNQSFAIMSDSSVNLLGTLVRQPWSIDASLCNRASRVRPSGVIPSNIFERLKCTLSSQSCINSSFIATNHYATSDEYHGLNLKDVRNSFFELMKCKHTKLIPELLSHLQETLLPSLRENPPGIEALRLYIILPELIVLIPENRDSLLLPFIGKLLALNEYSSRILDRWYQSLESGFFLALIEKCRKRIISMIGPMFCVQEVTSLLKLMEKLYKVNDSGAESIVSFSEFYIPELCTAENVEVDYRNWVAIERFSFCHYPFVFNTKAKALLLQIDLYLRIDEENILDDIFMRNLAALWGIEEQMESTCLIVNIRRDHLFEDAIKEIKDVANLKRPFRVKFVGEDGIDERALRKDFFLHLFEELLDPKRKLFRSCKDVDHLWFSGNECVSDDIYRIVGIYCGLAVNNGVVLDMNFPLELYKKLLGADLTGLDLKQIDPVLNRNLQTLAEFVENSEITVENTFCRDFTTDATTELIENGKNIAVTAANRNDYINAYVDHVFHKSVDAFANGFQRVCDSKVFKLYRPEELMEMAGGSKKYDWRELEKVTRYTGEYNLTRRPKVIVWFWKVFHCLSQDEKEEFLRFTTGSSKIPIQGLELTIQPKMKNESDGDAVSINDYLPFARTCFNILELPPYESKATLKTQLKKAIKTEGFHAY